jgi:glucokinase
MYLLFDIGGTRTRVAYSKDGVAIGEPVIFPTPHNFEEGIAAIVAAARELGLVGGAQSCVAAAGGAPGMFDEQRSMLIQSPHLPQWQDQPLRERLTAELGVPVFLENDAALAGLGEARRGAGKGFNVVEYMTISTGVGGARIVAGAIDPSRTEPGHEQLGDDSGRTFEEAVSGSALEKRMGKKPKEVSDPAVWDVLARDLARGLSSTIQTWKPDVIVLGGSMILGDPAISLTKTETYLKEIAVPFPEPLPPLRRAALGDSAGLYGALEFATIKTTK